jgi:hypothetical protein
MQLYDEIREKPSALDILNIGLGTRLFMGTFAGDPFSLLFWPAIVGREAARFFLQAETQPVRQVWFRDQWPT